MFLTFSWKWKMRSSPEDLWPYVSDTDRFNAMVGLRPVEVNLDQSARAPGHVLWQRIMGLTIEWEEMPFEWVAPRWFRVERRYRKGPFSFMRVTLNLDPLENGSLLTYTVEVQPAHFPGFLALLPGLGLDFRRKAERAFRVMDQLAAETGVSREKQRLSIPGKPHVQRPDLLEEYARRLREEGFGEDLVSRLVMHVRTAQDDLVARMHPRLLARRWGFPEEEVIRLFFHASRAGLLELRWDMVCPSCKGVPVAVEHLENLPETGYCPYCKILYEVDFEHTVQVTFRPHPAIRQVVIPVYCIGGPRNTPHLLAQISLQPGETRRLELPLMEEGEYRLRWPTHPQWREILHSFQEWTRPHPWQARIVVEAESRVREVRFALGESVKPSTARLHPGPVFLTVVNETAEPHRVGLERLVWMEHALTAFHVLNLQAFRNLFPFESLRKGMHVYVSSVTLLFTDLCGSTRFYRQVGDGPAFDRVVAHFEILRKNVEANQGAIVKTIGDAVMAVFSTPEAGIRAAIGILRDFARHNAVHPDWPLRIRMALNAGPALVVNLNEQLDYFGTTVNLAAKLERQSRCNQLLIPRDMAKYLPMDAPGIAVESDKVALPGERERISVVRVRVKEAHGG